MVVFCNAQNMTRINHERKKTFTYFIRTQYITCMQSDRFRDEKTSFNVPNTVINTKLRPHKSVKFKQSTKIYFPLRISLIPQYLKSPCKLTFDVYSSQ